MNLLRSIVASPKIPFVDSDFNFDLAYITPQLIVSSGPVNQYPQIFYRYDLNELVRFLDLRHGCNWYFWNFRSEDSHYSDADVAGKVHHFPFADHQPPPFEMIPVVVKSIVEYIGISDKNVALLHCKAGKGRSGTMACAYLLYRYQDKSVEEVVNIFTEKRMRLGVGISIKSQRRYLDYYKFYLSDEMWKNTYWGLKSPVISFIRIINPSSKELQLELKIEHYSGGEYVTAYRFDSSNSNDVKIQNDDIVIISPTNTRLSANDTKVSITVANSGWLSNSIAYIWFNLFFETVFNNREIKNERDMRNIKSTFRFAFEEMDGFKGTAIKGIKLFEAIEIYWHID